MAELKIWWSDVPLLRHKGERFKALVERELPKLIRLLQKEANRLVVGGHRYDHGKPTVAAKYLTRAKAEIAEYDKTGNLEHLINARNYLFLESIAPEHENQHYEHVNRSVTRNKLGMKL